MEAREAKRDAEMQQITQRLEEGIRTYLTSDHYTRYLNTMSRFHNKSRPSAQKCLNVSV